MSSNVIKLTFLGDLMCQMAQIRAVRRSRSNYDVVFTSVKSLWDDSNYVIANLETPVTGGRTRLAFEEMRFNAPVAFLRATRDAGIDFVSTANNHILDRGPRGVDATLRQIESLGLATTGAYRSVEESESIFVKEIKRVRFAFVACTYDTNSGRKADMLRDDDLYKVDYVHHPSPFIGTWMFAIKRTIKGFVPYEIKRCFKKTCGRFSRPKADSYPVEDLQSGADKVFLDRICQKIKRARTVADVVVALPHIGGQYNVEPGPWQLEITDALISAGADLVIANHAHTPLRAEKRRGVFSAYALGNFCFTPRVGYYNDSCQADYSIVLNCFFDTAARKLARQSFSVVKSVIRSDGVSVVSHPSRADENDVDVICRRVTGRDVHFPLRDEYEL